MRATATRYRAVLAATLLVACAAAPRAEMIAFVGARLIPISAADIENGVLVVEDGVIREAGPASEVRYPRRARVMPPMMRPEASRSMSSSME